MNRFNGFLSSGRNWVTSDALLKLSFYLFSVFIFFSPMAILTSVTEISFFTPAFLLLLLAILKRRKIHFNSPLLIPLLIFASWSFIGIFFALDKLYSLNDFISHLLKHLLLYLLVMNLVDTERKLNAVAWTFILSAFCFSVAVMIHEYIILENAWTERFGLTLIRTPTNLIGIVTIFATLLSIRFLLDASDNQIKALILGMLIPILLVTILTQARSNYIALFLSIPIALFRCKKILFPVMAALVLIVLFSPVKERIYYDGSVGHRISLFHISKEIIKDHPITGIGFGIDTITNPTLVSPDVYNARVSPEYRLEGIFFTWPHNIFLDIAVRLGLVGLVSFTSILIVCGRMLWRLSRYGSTPYIRNWALCILSALIMFLLKGSFDPVFSTIPEVVFFLILSITAVLWRMNRPIGWER